MPTPVKITGRTSTITNSFVNGIIPVIHPTEDEILEALRILEQDPADVRCVYCGDPATEWDHLRPLVRGKRPTGHISEIANLVPACGKCNQSKSGHPWRAWIQGSAARCPQTRGVKDLDRRVALLEAYEAWREPRRIDFASVIPAALWERHWANHDRMHQLMHESEETAAAVRKAASDAVEA